MRDTILLLFVAVVVGLWSDGFELRLLHLSDRFHLLTLVGLFLVIIATVLRIPFVHWKRYFRNYYFRAIVGLLAVVFFPTFINLVLINDLSLIEVFRSGLMYAGFLIFILLISYRTDISFVTRLSNAIFVISAANVLFLIALSFFPAVADSVLIDTATRFERIRLGVASGLTPMVWYSFFYSLVRCTTVGQSAKTRVFYAVIFSTFVWYYFIVFMGRRGIFALLIIISYYLLFHVSGLRKLKVAYALVLVLVLMLSFSQSSAVLDSFSDTIRSSYTSSLEDYESGEGTLTTRLQGLEYYFNEFRKTSYLGIGLPSTRLAPDSSFLAGRQLYRYHLGDQGIFAVFFQFGFFGVILTLIILFRMFKDLAAISRHGLPEHRAIAMAIWLYLCFSIVALLQIYWKPGLSLWTGLMFFMVWRMRAEITGNTPVLPEKQGYSGFAGAENLETSS